MLDHSAKIFIAGHKGMVGSAIVRQLEAGGYNNVIIRDKSELDLLSQQSVRDFMQSEKPDYVVLAAARVGGIQANNIYPAEFIYQNLMIEKGYSPYLNKYGNAQFYSLHKLYTQAESKAQSKRIGVWNQEEVNGREMRNYKALSIWWTTRAFLIDRYRVFKESGADLLNTRLDYAELKEKSADAKQQTRAEHIAQRSQQKKERLIAKVCVLARF